MQRDHNQARLLQAAHKEFGRQRGTVLKIALGAILCMVIGAALNPGYVPSVWAQHRERYAHPLPADLGKDLMFSPHVSHEDRRRGLHRVATELERGLRFLRLAEERFPDLHQDVRNVRSMIHEKTKPQEQGR